MLPARREELDYNFPSSTRALLEERLDTAEPLHYLEEAINQSVKPLLRETTAERGPSDIT
jgi:hypothetical protein